VSVRDATQGLPLGSVVEFAVDEAGKPVFATSSLSAHCTDLEKDGRASLTVMSPGFKASGCGRGR
jgi:putative heme iron utilization protein